MTGFRILIALGLAGVIASCGAEVAHDAARMGVNIEFPAPEFQTADAADDLAAIRTLSIMVCPNLGKAASAKARAVPCIRENPEAYDNAIKNISLNGSQNGTDTMHVPPAKNRVVYAEALDASNQTLYRGYVTMAVIQPRANYDITLAMQAVRKEQKVPPRPPVITFPVEIPPAAAEIAFGESILVKGTREAEADLLVVTGDKRLLGMQNNREEFGSHRTGTLYHEWTTGATTTWALTLHPEGGTGFRNGNDYTLNLFVVNGKKGLESERVQVVFRMLPQ